MANKRVVALDVGTTNITAVQGIVDGRTAIVDKIASVPTPKGAVRSNGIHDVTALAEALKEMWRAHDFQTKDVIAGVQSRRVQSGVKWVEFFHPDDLAAVASPEWVQAQNILPGQFETNAVSVFHYVLRERIVRHDPAKPEQRELLLAAVVVPKDEPQALANAVEDAGLELVGMDLTAFGTLRGTALVPRDNTRSADIIIDIGSTFVTLIMHVNGNFRAVATIPGIGGDSVTDHVRKELARISGLTTTQSDRAEDLKKALAVLESNQPNEPATVATQQAVRAQAQGLMREIDQMLERFHAATNNIPGQVEEHGLQSITLVGGGSALHNLTTTLADPSMGGLDIPVAVGATSQSFAWADGSGRIPPYVDGVSVVAALGLLLSDRKAA